MRVEREKEREKGERKFDQPIPVSLSLSIFQKLVADDLNVRMHISLRPGWKERGKFRSLDVLHSNVSNARGHTKVKAYFSHRPFFSSRTCSLYFVLPSSTVCCERIHLRIVTRAALFACDCRQVRKAGVKVDSL